MKYQTVKLVKPEGGKDHLSRFNKVVKPVNWKGIRDRYPDYHNMKGEFGEQIVKERLEEQGLRLEKQRDRAPGLPDFKVKGTPIFVEVKTHDKKTPPVWQKPLFSMMTKMGWEIYVAQPRLSITENSVSCRQIDWYRFMRDGRLDRIKCFPEQCS